MHHQGESCVVVVHSSQQLYLEIDFIRIELKPFHDEKLDLKLQMLHFCLAQKQLSIVALILLYSS